MARPPHFRISAIAELLHQLRYAPAERKRRQMEAAESLLGEVLPDAAYPEDFIVFRITAYRPEIDTPAIFVGGGLLADLPTFIERLSHDLALDRSVFPTREPVPVDEVMAELGISRSTLTRYRKQGLVAHHLVLQKGQPPRLVIFRDALERFIAGRPQQVAQARSFSRVDARTRERIIRRARRYEQSLGLSLNEAAARLSRRFGRSLEGVRQILLRYDKSHPKQAIFNNTGPLSPRDHRFALRASAWGVPVSQIARRLGRNRSRIYQALQLARLERMQAWPLTPVTLPTFRLDEADAVILAPRETRSGFEPWIRGFGGESQQLFGVSTSASGDAGGTARSRDLDETVESALFGAMNFLIFDARSRRDRAVGGGTGIASELDEIETRLRWATRIKRRLMFAWMPLVLRTLEVHAGRALAVLPQDVAIRLHALGVRSLAEAVDRFDPSGTARFASFLNLHLRRVLARSALHDLAGVASTRATRIARPESGFGVPDPMPVVHPWQASIDFPRYLIGRFDRLRHEADRSTGMDGALALRVLEVRFALEGGDAPCTTAQTAALLNRTTTVIAATETRAVHRLRGLSARRSSSGGQRGRRAREAGGAGYS